MDGDAEHDDSTLDDKLNVQLRNYLRSHMPPGEPYEPYDPAKRYTKYLDDETLRLLNGAAERVKKITTDQQDESQPGWVPDADAIAIAISFVSYLLPSAIDDDGQIAEIREKVMHQAGAVFDRKVEQVRMMKKRWLDANQQPATDKPQRRKTRKGKLK